MGSQDCAGNLDNDCQVVPSMIDEELKDAQILDHEHCRFMELVHETQKTII